MSRLRMGLLVAVGVSLVWPASSVPGVAQAADVPTERPLTIDDAVGLALANHPDLSIAVHNADAARGATRQTRSSLRPSLSLRSDWSRSMSSGSTVVSGVQVGGGGDRHSTQYSTSISADQLIFDFGRTRDEVRRSHFDQVATDHQLAQTEDDVINYVRQAFLALLTNGELLEVVRYRVQLQDGTAEQAQAQFDAGTVPRADVAKAASALAAAQLDVTSAQNAVAAARIALNEAMGVDVRTTYAVAGVAAPELPEATLDVLLDAALANRPEVLAARADSRAAEASLSVAKKGQRPSVSGGASYGARANDFPPDRDYWNLGVSLSMSIFDGELTKGRKQQARAQLEAARGVEYRMAQLVAQETAQSLLDLQTAVEEIRASEITIASADEDLRLANGRYAADLGILLEVLDAQAALTEAQADLARAKFSRGAAHYALERAVGVPLDQLNAMDTQPTE